MTSAITAYDVSAIMILIVGLAYFYRTNRDGALHTKIIMVIMVLGIIGGLSDILRLNVQYSGSAGTFTWNFLNSVYLTCVSTVAPLYVLYIISSSDTWHLFKNKIDLFIACIPEVLGLLICISGLFSPSLFYVEDGVVKYGVGYVLVNVFIVFYILGALRYIIRLSKYYEVRGIVQLLIPLAIVSVALLIQAFTANHILCFAIATDCLLLLLINRRSEESVNVTSGMHSYWLFASEMKLRLLTRKKMNIILINIINYDHALNVLGYDELSDLMKFFSAGITAALKESRRRFQCYNRNGCYAIEISTSTEEETRKIAEELLQYVNANIKPGASDFEIKVNACTVKCPEDVEDIDSLFMLISNLDIYPVENRVLSASEITSTNEFIVKKEMNVILDKAITNGYFEVYYQPIYNTEKKRFASAEALIRLKDPKYGFISPGVFIPVSEKNGMIHKIGSFVIDEVCKFIASEEFESLGVDYIEINLSIVQCLRRDIASEIIDKALEYDIDPDKINLEITETASGYSMDRISGNMNTLNRAGFLFSLDDFGTGYSNLMRVTSLPLDIIKLDRTFVLLMEKGNSTKAIENIILMVKDMGKKVLVEGIETEEMVEVFTNLGVDEIQGFYFSKPLPKGEYISFVRQNNVV